MLAKPLGVVPLELTPGKGYVEQLTLQTHHQSNCHMTKHVRPSNTRSSIEA
jgi:hypothetical protein